jgi:hypothetical protein
MLLSLQIVSIAFLKIIPMIDCRAYDNGAYIRSREKVQRYPLERKCPDLNMFYRQHNWLDYSYVIRTFDSSALGDL